MTEAHVCDQLAQTRYMNVEWPDSGMNGACNLSIASLTPIMPLYYTRQGVA